MKKKLLIPVVLLLLMVIGVCIFIFYSKESAPFQPDATPPSLDIATNTLIDAEYPVSYTWPDERSYEAMLHGLGFTEFFIPSSLDNSDIVRQYSMETLTITQDTFCLEMKYSMPEYNIHNVRWVLYGTKAPSLQNIAPLEVGNFAYVSTTNFVEEGMETGEIREVVEYAYYLRDPALSDNSLTICQAAYYPETNNVYNLVATFDSNPFEQNVTAPYVLWTNAEDKEMYSTKNSQFHWYGDHVVETAEFSINRGKTQTYRYRVGMTFQEWASSELAKEEWFIGVGNICFSSDFAYAFSNVDLDIRTYLDDTAIIYVTASDDNIQEYINATKVDFSSWLTPTTIAHLVNWETNLSTSGIKIETEFSSNLSYMMTSHSTVFQNDETISVYLRGVNDLLIDDIKLYVFKESQDFIDYLDINDGFLSHTPGKNLLLEIPDDATAISFSRVNIKLEESESSDEHDENNEHKEDNLPPNIIMASFVPDKEPNYTPYNNNVMVITYKDDIVYWIHTPIWSTETNIFNFNKIEIFFEPDMTFHLESDYYSEEELQEAYVMLENDPEWLNSMKQAYEAFKESQKNKENQG